MLVDLSIRDLALIEAAELSFGPGLNVISGETGAGKSLLVGALELALGLRARVGGGGQVRKGAKEARVEARFEFPRAKKGGSRDSALAVGSTDRALAIGSWLEAHLPDFVEEWELSRELILGRTITSEGRTRARVNQRPVPLKSLRGLAELFLEIHGQNDHQKLCEADEQLRLVDAYGGAGKLLASYRETRDTWLQAVGLLSDFYNARGKRRDRLDLLRFQVAELEAARLEPGEMKALQAERELLRHGGDLRGELGGISDSLSESDNALLDQVRAMEVKVTAWSRRVDGLAETTEAFREAVVYMEEAAAGLVSFADAVEVDPARLEEVEERMDELERLCAKFGADEAGLVDLAQRLELELESLVAKEGSSDFLEAGVDAARKKVAAAAKKLTKARTAAQKPLAKEVETALTGLELGKARFQVALCPRNTTGGTPSQPAAGDVTPELALPKQISKAVAADIKLFGKDGVESIEFLLAANPGEPAAPLSKVASGGEAARIMLAVRGVLAASDRGRTLVFDEVDAGVGGRLGPAVAGRLRDLGEGNQVLCITHLPSIAAAAHLHQRVAKEVRAGRTVTIFDELSRKGAEAERVSELADMIAGGAKEKTARAEAGRLLKSFA
jgi:DNA repair protein RecN (Recombination protein N)